MEQTLQELSNMYSVISEKYSDLELEYVVRIGKHKRNISFTIPHHHIVEMSLLPIEVYRCIVDFYIDKCDSIKKTIVIEEEENNKFGIYLTSQNEVELKNPSPIDKILTDKIQYFPDNILYNAEGIFTENTCRCMKKLLNEKHLMIEKLAQKIIDEYFSDEKIVNSDFSVEIWGGLDLLPTPFTTLRDKYLLIMRDEKNNDYTVMRDENSLRGCKKVTYEEIRAFFDNTTKFLKEEYEATYQGEDVIIEICTDFISVTTDASFKYANVINISYRYML